MRSSEVQPILAAYAYLQNGLVTSAQAASEGIDTTTMTRMVQRDIVRRIRRGVYISASVAEDSNTEVRAAWMSTNPAVLAEQRLEEEDPIVVSHVSAASLLSLGDITPAKHTFTSTKRKQSSASDISIRKAPLDGEDWIVVDGIPVTNPVRTIADLAKDHLDGDQLLHVIADAVNDRGSDQVAIARALEKYSEQYGFASGEGLLGEALRLFSGRAANTAVTRAQIERLSATVAALQKQIFARYADSVGVPPVMSEISKSLGKTIGELLRKNGTVDTLMAPTRQLALEISRLMPRVQSSLEGASSNLSIDSCGSRSEDEGTGNHDSERVISR